MQIRLGDAIGDTTHDFGAVTKANVTRSGIWPMLRSAYVGEGLNRWTAVQRLDAAPIYWPVLVLEKGVAGARYHAVAEADAATAWLASERKAWVPCRSRTLKRIRRLNTAFSCT